MIQKLDADLSWAYFLNESALHDWVLNTWYIWPTLETLHFIGLCILMGPVLVVDLRLLGFYKELKASTAERLVLIALVGFAINLATGICFLAGNTWKYAEGNLAFDIKLVLLLVLGVNALVYRLKLEDIFQTKEVTNLSRLVGGISLLLWCLVIVCGRMITFFAGYS